MRVAPLESALTWPLRQAILRPHQKVEEMGYPGDALPGAGHFGAWDGEILIGVATIHPEPFPHSSEPGAWRVRGMAVLPDYRARGVGSALLAEATEHARRLSGVAVWCHARTGALALYERHGFLRRSEPYDLPGIGPHVLLHLSL